MNIYSSLFQHKGLSLERLQSFCLVAEKGGFNKAAGDNPYKQAQFSKQIADLEKFFGSPLFIRKGRTIELTSQGRELYNLCKTFFFGLHGLKIDTATKKHKLIISAGQSVIDFLLPQAFDQELLSNLTNACFISRSSEDAIEDVLNYRAHCALVSRTNKAKDIIAIPIISSDIIMLCAKDKEKLFYTGNDIIKLAKNPIAIMQGQGELRNATLKLFGKTKPNILFEAPTFLALKRLANSGKAISFIPEYALDNEDKQTLTAYPLPGKHALSRSIYLIYRKNLLNQNKPLASIIKKLGENIKNLP